MNIKKAAIFARAKNEEAVAMQLSKCRAYAQSKKWKIVGEYVEICGCTRMYPSAEINSLIEAAKQKVFDGVLITDASRVSRKLHEYFTFRYQLNEIGVNLVDAVKGESIPNDIANEYIAWNDG